MYRMASPAPPHPQHPPPLYPGAAPSVQLHQQHYHYNHQQLHVTNPFLPDLMQQQQQQPATQHNHHHIHHQQQHHQQQQHLHSQQQFVIKEERPPPPLPVPSSLDSIPSVSQEGLNLLPESTDMYDTSNMLFCDMDSVLKTFDSFNN